MRQLALQYARSPLSDGSFLVYLTARDQSRGEEALESLRRDAQLKRATALKADGGLVEIKFHALDITDDGSVETFTKYLRETHTHGIDLIISKYTRILHRRHTLTLRLHSSCRQCWHRHEWFWYIQ